MKNKVFNGLPHKIKIGALDVRIVLHTFDEPDVHGEASYGDLTIRINRQAPSTQFATDTLWHEIEHIIFKMYSFSPADSEERQVSLRATVWTQILRDNPQLLAWISRGLRGR